MNGGVTHRPAGSKSSASHREPVAAPALAANVALALQQRRPAQLARGVEPLRPPSAASTPVSSNSSRAAAATQPRAGRARRPSHRHRRVRRVHLARRGRRRSRRRRTAPARAGARTSPGPAAAMRDTAPRPRRPGVAAGGRRPCIPGIASLIACVRPYRISRASIGDSCERRLARSSCPGARRPGTAAPRRVALVQRRVAWPPRSAGRSTRPGCTGSGPSPSLEVPGQHPPALDREVLHPGLGQRARSSAGRS